MMNPFDWEASARRWQTSMSTSMEASGRREDPTGRHASRVYHQHRADTVEDPLNRLLTVQSGPAGQCPSASTFYPDETDQEDHELTRKIKELRKLEESERCKKVSLACKSVLDPSVAASDEESGGCTGSSLSDRVNAILQQRQSNSFLSKVSSWYILALLSKVAVTVRFPECEPSVSFCSEPFSQTRNEVFWPR